MKNRHIDASNIIGFGSGFIMLIVVLTSRGNPAIFINIPSLLIVFLGTIASTLNAYSIKSIGHTCNVIAILFTRGINLPFSMVIDQIAKASEVLRKEGPLALDRLKFTDRFLEQGIKYLVDGTKTNIIMDILEIENIALAGRHKESRQILESMGIFAPAWGMIGTIIGLIFMLLTLEEPSNIGPAMATALLTTFYGAVLANFIFIPFATKFENLSNNEIFYRRFIIEGIMSVANSENPRIIREKLLAFLNPEEKYLKSVEIDRIRREKLGEIKTK